MAELNEIRRLLRVAADARLENRGVLAKYADAQLAAMYNGIGPESFPAWLRAALDALHPSLAAAAFIHDVEWTESDGTRASFDASNARFRRNGLLLAKALHAWWSPRRYLVAFDAWRFSRACARFGWGAWTAAHAARGAEAAR